MGQSNPIDRQINILLVEDEILILEMVKEALADSGFAVHAVCSASEALRYLMDGSTVDVLFTDINLADGMDGSMLAMRAREIRPELPVVYASGGVTALNPLRAVPGSAFVPKPYDTAKICDMLARVAVAH